VREAFVVGDLEVENGIPGEEAARGGHGARGGSERPKLEPPGICKAAAQIPEELSVRRPAVEGTPVPRLPA
jgi:hypothetical protein